MKKKIILFSLSFLLFISAVFSIYYIRLALIKNGSVSLVDGKLVATPDVGYVSVGWSNGESSAEIPYSPFKILFVTPIFEKEKLSLPVISIDTEMNQAVLSKEDYVNCDISISNTEAQFSFEGSSARIKRRGNSTYANEKPPYKIKFDEKIGLFGGEEAKEWTLIANHMDYSLMRNYIAYELGAELENLDTTTKTRYAELYLNGEYLGLYLVCEQVEAGKGRVDISEELDTTDTGYLIELDARAPSEGVEMQDYFVANDGNNYAIKSPDTEEDEFTVGHVEFIRDYVNSALAALDSKDWNSVCGLIDIESFVDGYILDEIMHTVDVGFSSFYIHKDAGGKLVRGPIWDYDLSCGNTVALNANDPQSFYARTNNVWYSKLLEYTEFSQLVAERLDEKGDSLLGIINGCFEYADTYRDAFERNFEKWQILGVHEMEYTSPEVCAIDSLDGQLNYLKNWLSESLAHLRSSYTKTQ